MDMENCFFIISGIVSFIVAIYRICKKNKFIEINGICTYVKERSFDKKCGYKYEYNGYEYEHYDKGYYLFFKARKGEICKLYINPDEPKEVYTHLQILQ